MLKTFVLAFVCFILAHSAANAAEPAAAANFEDGKLGNWEYLPKPGKDNGSAAIIDAPADSGSKKCVKLTATTKAVEFENTKDHFKFEPGLVFTCKIMAESNVKAFRVKFVKQNEGEAKGTVFLVDTPCTEGKWDTITIKLDELKDKATSTKTLAAGDTIVEIETVVGASDAEKPMTFHIADILVAKK